jgi:enoyl-CoA hydratase
MSSYENILLNVEDHIATLTINRPDKLNALNKDTLLEIKCAFQQICLDKDIKALIITGAGEKAFIAGADINEIAALDESDARTFSENGQKIFRLIENSRTPVIGAINGYALGGGCELALSCHLRLASQNAQLGLPEASLGILPAFGGTQRLTRLIGKGMALEIMLTGDMISAERAVKIGLVNHMVDHPSELIPACKKVLQKILRNAPLSAGKIITATNAAYSKDGYQVETDCFADLIKTDDFTEGTKAFIEKRTAKFIGS